MKRLAALFALLPGIAFAQSSPNWKTGYVPPAQEWNAWWSSKANQNNGTLNIPSISGGSINGTVIGATTPAAGSFTTVNLTASQGLQFGGVNGLFVTVGNAWQQGVYGGPRAGAYMQSNNLPQSFGMVAFGVASLENLINQGAEAACGGAFSCQYATTASAMTGWGEHVIGFDNSNDMTAGGNDAMRDTIGCLDCTGWGSSTQSDGTGNTNTSLGAFSLWGNAGSITVTGNPTIGDVYHIALTTTNANVVGLPATVSFTATTTSANDLAAGLANAIVSLSSTVTYLLPSGRTTWTDSGVGISAFPSLNVVKMHFPGSQVTGWSITPATSCTGACTATLSVGVGFSGTDNIALGSHSLAGFALTSASFNFAGGDSSLVSLAGSSSGIVCLGHFCGASALSGGNSFLGGYLVAFNATVLTNDAIISPGLTSGPTTGTNESIFGVASAAGVYPTTATGASMFGYGCKLKDTTTDWQGCFANAIYTSGANIGGGGSSYGQVGIGGDFTGGAILGVLGPDTSSGTLVFRVRNSTPANLFSVGADGTIKVGVSTGVSCPSGVTAGTVVVVNGLVTHC